MGVAAADGRCTTIAAEVNWPIEQAVMLALITALSGPEFVFSPGEKRVRPEPAVHTPAPAAGITMKGTVTETEPCVTVIGFEPSASDGLTVIVPVRFPDGSTVAVPVSGPFVNRTMGVPPFGSQCWPETDTTTPGLPWVGFVIAVVGGDEVAGTKLFDGADGRLGPNAFVAVAVQVYVLPPDSPVTTIGLAAPAMVAVAPPSDDAHVTAYPVIALPPSFVGGTNETVADAVPGTAIKPLGTPGTAPAGGLIRPIEK